MTSATGRADNGGHSRSRGFSLAEIILVFVLIGLFSGLVVLNVNSIFRHQNEPPLERVIIDAVREARFQAATNKEIAWLEYIQDTGTFNITLDSREPTPALPPDSMFGSGLSFSTVTNDAEEKKDKPPASLVKSYKVFVPEDQNPPKIKFFAIPPGLGYDGDPDDEPEDIPLRRVPFDPGGYTVPFIMEVDSRDEGIQGSFQFDIFSNHVLKKEGFGD